MTTFFIVEFIQQPFNGIDKHVCVPASWVRWGDDTSNKVIVSYPGTKSSETDVLVENSTKYSEEWKLYEASIVCSADTYSSAMQYIETNKLPLSAVNDNFNKLFNMLDKMNKRINHLEEIIKSGNNTIEDFGLADLSIASTSRDNLVDRQEITENVDRAIEEDDEMNDHDKSQPDIPPGIDITQPRWTLKHPNYEKGLVELIAKSSIYVDETALVNLKTVSKTCNQLARGLLEEVFNEDALKLCSFTGKKAANAKTRPPLDTNGRKALLTYVVTFGVKKKLPTDTKAILSSLRNKLYDFKK